MNRRDQLAHSVTLMVWARVAMVTSAFILAVTIPIAGWLWGEIWSDTKEIKDKLTQGLIKDAQHDLILETHKQGLHDLDRRIGSLEFHRKTSLGDDAWKN